MITISEGRYYTLERCVTSGERTGEVTKLIASENDEAVQIADDVGRSLEWRSWVLADAAGRVIAFRDPGSSQDPWSDTWLFIVGR